MFRPIDESLHAIYETYLNITDIFTVNSVGIVTAGDNLTIRWTKEEVWQTVLNFSKLDPELARQTYDLGKDVRDWKVELAQKDVTEKGLDRKKITPILYRPFDIRYTYYTGKSRGFICMPRPEIMKHMFYDNIALITPKQFKEESGAFVTNNIAGHKTVSAYDINYTFPLYLYPLKEKKGLFHAEGETKEPNIKPEILKFLSKAYKKDISPEEIFYYIYAVLYSETYRTKYAEFLKIDFPRVPFTKEFKLFKKMSEYGNRLVNLHLLKSQELDSPIARFQGTGDNSVGKPKYDDKAERGHISKEQYFGGISEEVWRYQIGGYQVCDKWLKDRKDRILSLDEIQTYCRIVTAIQKTIDIQTAIDDVYEEVEKTVVPNEMRE